MNIQVSRGIGEGPTPLAAFDAALRAAGVGDYNLLVLSSVIPPGSKIVVGRHEPRADEYGNLLYVVMARAEAAVSGASAWAGLGWAQGEDGCGLFVEEHGNSEHEVRAAIRATLGAMIEARGAAFGPINEEISGAVCCDAPACAVVTAVFCSAPW